MARPRGPLTTTDYHYLNTAAMVSRILSIAVIATVAHGPSTQAFTTPSTYSSSLTFSPRITHHVSPTTMRMRTTTFYTSRITTNIISKLSRLCSTRDPDMRQCNTIEDLVHLAYDHLDTISPQGIAAFWSLSVKHVQNHRGNSQVQLNEQLAEILCNTLENMKRYSHRDISTIAISLAKIMKQVESHGQRAATGSLQRILHNLLVGINSESKQVIFDKVTKTSVLILSEFDARHLSNLIYSFSLAEYVPKVKDGRTILDVLAREAMSKLNHFNSQDLSNMLCRMQKWSHRTRCYSRQQVTRLWV